MKKKYTRLDLEIFVFDEEDIITDSTYQDGYDDDGEGSIG